MRKFLIYALSLSASLVSVQKALGLPLPHINQNQSYRALRQELIDMGWQPATFELENEFETVRNHIHQVEGWHEIEACSGTGLGFCKFIFQDEQGNQLSITTVNNDPVFPASERYRIYGWDYYTPVK